MLNLHFNMTTRQHYEQHLAPIYTWMTGDVTQRSSEFESFCREIDLFPKSHSYATDLGAGNGIQSLALARLGFNVASIDFNPQLLSELRALKDDLPIEIIQGDIRDITKLVNSPQELILCCGDTLTHLETISDVKQLIVDCMQLLTPSGKLLCTFRDYSREEPGTQHIIPVKSDNHRILTCILDYMDERVRVTDLVHEPKGGAWAQRASSYFKLRLSPVKLKELLAGAHFRIIDERLENGFVVVLAQLT